MMDSSDYNRYLIAILFPSYINDELKKHKNILAVKYGSKIASFVISHITLKTPIDLPAHLHKQFVEWFQSMPISVAAFQQELDGFGAFHNTNNPVIYAKPINIRRLKRLQKEIIYYFSKSPFKEPLHTFDNPYKPHATIAYRDLSVPAFQKAWEEYKSKEYYTSFNINSFYLLQLSKKGWLPVSEYCLPLNSTLTNESQLSLLSKKLLHSKSTVLTLF